MPSTIGVNASANGDHLSAFKEHEKVISSEIERVRKIAFDFADEFVPDSRFAIWKRKVTSRLTSFQFVMNSFVNRFTVNSI